MQRQTYQNLKRNEAQFLSVTGFSLTCFDGLFLNFEVQWDKYIRRYTIAGKARIRPPRSYKNKVFEDTQSMLVFILYYLKNNCLQESQAAMFGMNQPQANVWIHLLKTILLQALKASNSLLNRCKNFFKKVRIFSLMAVSVPFPVRRTMKYKKSIIAEKKRIQ